VAPTDDPHDSMDVGNLQDRRRQMKILLLALVLLPSAAAVSAPLFFAG